jgi:hypothetical protein
MNLKHGMYGTPTYNSWAAMKQRCYYEKHIEFERYGARGIKVCERWHDFIGFFADMGVRPDGCTIDRIDPDGDYEPGNCRWATGIEQANNCGSNHVICWQGRALTAAEWAREVGFKNGGVITKRLRRGWSIGDALGKPNGTFVNEPGGKATQFQPVTLEFNGERKSISEWAQHLGFANPSAISKRLRRGLPLSDVLSPPQRKRKN